MWDSRTRLGGEVVDRLREEHSVTVWEPFVPKSVRVAEAPGRGLSVLDHARSSKAAAAYRALAQRLEIP
jgi:chromosome partitioning protein